MKTIITIVTMIFSFFLVSNVNAQSPEGSKALDALLKLKASTNEDVTDKYKGTYKYNEKGELISSDFKKTTVRNHYWYGAIQTGITTKGAYDLNVVLGRHMRGVNLYGYMGAKQMKYDKADYNLDPTAMQFGFGAQIEVVSLLTGHSPWQVAFGAELGANNVSYNVQTSVNEYKYRDVYKGFALAKGVNGSVSYNFTENFSAGGFVRFSTYKVANDRESFDTNKITNDKLTFNDLSFGLVLRYNINVFVK